MAAVISRRKKARIEKEAVQIPEDVAMEILKMLPVKSLLRFSCACKTWYSVISDPDFRNKFHQKRAAHLLIYRKPITYCSWRSAYPESCDKSPQKKCAHVLACGRPNRFSTVTIEESLLMNEKPLSLPWQPEPECGSITKFLGSCNGLVCIFHTCYCHSRRGLILWNPSTRKFRNLPSATRIGGLYDKSTYAGFGYDESAGDYKFVWMVIKSYPPSEQRIEFDVFSLKSKTWTSFDHCQPSDMILSGTDMYWEHRGVLSNGAIHWIICYKENIFKCGKRICAFDLASGTYRLLELPRVGGRHWNIVSLSGFLCCLYTRDDMAGGSSMALWMMKEYGVVSSWTIMSWLPAPLSLLSDISLHKYPPIHSPSEDGMIVGMGKHYAGCQIMRLRVKKGAIVSYENVSVLSEDAQTIVFEETFCIP